MNCLGQDPLTPLFAAVLAEIRADQTYPLDDRSALSAAGFGQEESPIFRELVSDRFAWRRFLREQGVARLDFWQAESFEQFSAGVLKRERFPLALKSRQNLSGGAGTYRLEGFRDLTRFWERLQKICPGPALVEDWVQAQVVIELTMLPDGFLMPVQVGLEQALTCRTAWRMFPVVVPERWRPGLARVVQSVEKTLSPRKAPIRLTVGLMPNGEVVPQSLNAGLNRLEYLPQWSGGCWDGRSLLTRHLGLEAVASSGKGRIARLQMLRRPGKMPPFPAVPPEPVQASGAFRKYAACGRHAVVLLCGDDPKKLAVEGRTVATLLAAQEDSE